MFDLTRQYEVKVLVKGRSVTEYLHTDGAVYIEGRRGSEFELEFNNQSWERILAVPSVDGLSVMDGKTAGLDSDGYVIEAHQKLIIPGWRLDENNCAKFVFEDTRDSYSNRTGRGTSNNGVIGFLVFRSKYGHWSYNQFNSQWITPTAFPNYPPGYGGCVTATADASMPSWIVSASPHATLTGGSLACGAGGNAPTSPTASGGGGTTCSAGGGSPMAYSAGGSASMSPTMSANTSETHPSFNKMTFVGANATSACNTSTAKSVLRENAQLQNVVADLGTGFGDQASFATVDTTFEKRDPGNPDAMLICYYDSKRGLACRGINLGGRYATPNTNAFPGYKRSTSPSVTPPPGWRPHS